MLILIIFAFIAGIVTILSPCILPMLPIILSSSVGEKGESKHRPYGIVLGFIASFTFFTLFLSTIVQATNISADSLRLLSVIVIGLFGISLLIPQIQTQLEYHFSKLSSHIPQTQNRSGFGGGIMVGLSLGLLWTPCVGPILASVISLAITGSVTAQAFFITLAYSVGTALPMFAIMYGGRSALQKVPFLTQNTSKIQKLFGIIMIITAIGIYFNIDRKFQTYILETFPNYGTGLTQIEDNDLVKELLDTSPNESEQTSSALLKKASQMAPEIIPGGEWINSEPLSMEKLRGKVVLIDFWTYSCINCQRTFPYLRTWWDTYQDDGLVIIGVHSPEFEFEKDINNVLKATNDFDLTYPIVQDNNFATWRAYSNRYWPAKYLIDANGYIRYTHYGEGKYNETEEAVQLLLTEANTLTDKKEINNPVYSIESQTPETYLGYARIDNFESPEEILQDDIQPYSIPNNVPKNTFAISGTWTITPEFAHPQPGASLEFNFTSKDVFLVLNPVTDSEPMVSVYLDDQFVKTISIDSDSLYQLIELQTAGQHILRLEFPDGNVEAYAFTFG